jgi:hypothetical protein
MASDLDRRRRWIIYSKATLGPSAEETPFHNSSLDLRFLSIEPLEMFRTFELAGQAALRSLSLLRYWERLARPIFSVVPQRLP